jgi:hypothetical protein
MSSEGELAAIRREEAHGTVRFADVSLHRIDGQNLLLDPRGKRLYVLNASAAFIWSALKDGMPPAEIGRTLTEELALSEDAAASYVADVLRQYEELVCKPQTTDPETAAPAQEPRPAVLSAMGIRRPRLAEASAVETYALLDSVFRVRFNGAGLFAAIHPLLRPAMKAHDAEAKVVDVAVLANGDGVAVIANGDLVGASETREEAAVMVRACLMQLAVMSSGGFCAVHAGALGRNGQALLLPGNAGYGKSTLSAALAATGFDMLCDDTALIGGEPPMVRSLPMGLCLKRGCCSVLQSRYPQLPSLAQWRRPDGKQARYLMPGEDVRWAGADAALAARWIAFPHYHPDHATALLPLAKHEALARLLPGIYLLSGSLDAENLERVIAWIEGVECFELPLSSLDTATALLDELCR